MDFLTLKSRQNIRLFRPNLRVLRDLRVKYGSSSQRLLKIANQVIGMFQSDGQPQQILRRD